MLKNFWPCIMLLCVLSPNLWADQTTQELDEDEDAVYRADQTEVFNQEEEELNDRGLIRDTEGGPMSYEPKSLKQPIDAKVSDCTPTSSNSDECEDIEITN